MSCLALNSWKLWSFLSQNVSVFCCKDMSMWYLIFIRISDCSIVSCVCIGYALCNRFFVSFLFLCDFFMLDSILECWRNKEPVGQRQMFCIREAKEGCWFMWQLDIIYVKKIIRQVPFGTIKIILSFNQDYPIFQTFNMYFF